MLAGPCRLFVLRTVVIFERFAQQLPCALCLLRQLPIPALSPLFKAEREWLALVVLGFSCPFHLVIVSVNPQEGFNRPVEFTFKLEYLYQRSMSPYLEYFFSLTACSVEVFHDPSQYSSDGLYSSLCHPHHRTYFFPECYAPIFPS